MAWNAHDYRQWNLPRHDATPYRQRAEVIMYLIAIAWMYVVVMMALAEALSPQGTVLGAVFTLLLYGLLPLGIVMYLLGTPMRRRALRAAEAKAPTGPEQNALQSPAGPAASAPKPDSGGHAAGDAVTPERKEV
jgi:amino acid permease